MSIKEVVEGFASVRYAKDQTRRKLAQHEQMLDKVFKGQMPEFVELPSWIIQKLDHAKETHPE